MNLASIIRLQTQINSHSIPNKMDTARVLKDLGTRAFRQQKYQDALELYTQALEQVTAQEATEGGAAVDADAAVLCSNTSAVLLKLDRAQEALQYATSATQLAPTWSKAWYRKASALQALQQHVAAAEALQRAQQCTLEGSAEAAAIAGRAARLSMTAAKLQAHAAVQQGLLSGHTAWAKNRAREASTREELTQQLQQGMAGYAWEPEDWEWRPTWTPSMRAATVAVAPAAGAAAGAAAPAAADGALLQVSTDLGHVDMHEQSCVGSSTSAGLNTGSTGAGLNTGSFSADPAAGRRLLAALDTPPGSTPQQQQQIRQLLARLTVSLADLAAPQRGLQLLQDQPLLDWYQHSIEAAIKAASTEAAAAGAGAAASASAANDAGAGAGAGAASSSSQTPVRPHQRQEGPTVLVLASGGGGLLALIAAAAGAGRVVVVEKSRWAARACKQLLDANRAACPELVDRIQLVPGPLSSCHLATEAEARPEASCDAPETAAVAAGTTAAGGNAGGADFTLMQQADVLVTDMFDYSVLGQGVLGAVQSAAAAGLLAPHVRLVPEHVRVKGQLVSTVMSQQQSGFDLSPVNRYKWHPTIEHLDPGRYQQLQAASPSFTLHDIPLGACTKPTPSVSSTLSASASSTAAVSLHPGSQVADALLLWCELVHGASTLSTGPAAAPAAATAQASTPAAAAAAATAGTAATATAAATAAAATSTAAAASPSELPAEPAAPLSPPEHVKCHSRHMGMGLYYLDRCLPAQPAGSQAATVRVTTSHSPADVRLVFRVDLVPATPLALSNASNKGCSNGGSNTNSSGRSSGGSSGGSNASGHTSTHTSSSTSAHTLQQSNTRLLLSSTPSSSSPAGRLSGSHPFDAHMTHSPSWWPHGMPRHAWLPRWHFDMLGDTTRNNAYDTAIRRAIAQLREDNQSGGEAASGNGPKRRLHVLDFGAGTGLLSLMAIRSGADAVTAVEAVRHMADTANSVVELNGLRGITVVHKDARYLKDVAAKGDLLVFEVFDCGCIGEGALHLIAAARSHLKLGARILPGSAQVYCQPIQYGAHIEQRTRLPFDTSSLAPYAWQQGYFEADLAAQQDSNNSGNASNTSSNTCSNISSSSSSGTPLACWKALAPAQPVFAFDFNTPDPLTAFQPASQQLSFTINTAGVCNAVAFWFELQLDEHTVLSSSPHRQQPGQPHTTWKQAVQLLPEHRVQPGQVASITASHDTYAISFSLTTPPPAVARNHCASTAPAAATTPPVSPTTPQPPATPTHSSTASAATTPSPQSAVAAVAAAAGPTAPQATGVPLYDPLWKAAYDELCVVQGHLAKSIAQDPLEHRRVVAAALQLAMEPWGPVGGGLKESDAGPVAQQQGPEAGTQARLQQQQQQQQRPDRRVGLVADPHQAAVLLTRLMA